MATGQLGTKNFKGNAAPVFLWDIPTGKRLLILRGLTVRVNLLQFSTDDSYICGCGEVSVIQFNSITIITLLFYHFLKQDCSLYIWDISSGEPIVVQRTSTPASILRWTGHFQDGRRLKYELVLGIGSNLNLGLLYFDPSRVQWALKLKNFTLPPGHGGLTRFFYCAESGSDGISVYVGSTGGDLLIYRRDTAIFRACIPVCKNGLHSVLSLPDG
jgi:WD40 repeat protein